METGLFETTSSSEVFGNSTNDPDGSDHGPGRVCMVGADDCFPVRPSWLDIPADEQVSERSGGPAPRFTILVLSRVASKCPTQAALWLKRSDLVRIVEIRISAFIMMKVAA
jgi:hypothetical protein